MGLGQGIHRETDKRVCHGAVTGVVMLQSTVRADGKLVAVNGDINTHGSGELIAGCNQVFVEGKLVVNIGDDADEDNLYNTQGHTAHPHGNPKVDPTPGAGGSLTVFVGE